MSAITGPGITKAGLRMALQLWPFFLVWPAWSLAGSEWQAYLAGRPQFFFFHTGDLGRLSPVAVLVGPSLVMAAAIMIHRMEIGSRAMALAGVLGLISVTLLTGAPEYQRLWCYVAVPGISPITVLRHFDPACGLAIFVGLVVAFVGYCIATTARLLGQFRSCRLAGHGPCAQTLSWSGPGLWRPGGRRGLPGRRGPRCQA